MNRVATLATAEKEKAIGEHTSIVQMPPERNEPSCLGGGIGQYLRYDLKICFRRSTTLRAG